MKNCASFLIIHSLLFHPSSGLQLQKTAIDSTTSRRNAISTIFSGTAAAAMAAVVPSTWLLSGSAANAAAARYADRGQLLDAIARKASDDEVMSIIQNLKDPSEGKGAAYPDRLEGQWELIWSYKAEAFSPLLKLPRPFRPASFQYLGSPAAQEVGQGRLAQGLTGGILGNSQLWLSSGAVPFEQNPSVLEIQPPFRLEIGGRYGTGKPKKVLVEAGSDAEFRKVNARTLEEQLARKNQYQQIYLENNGPGSLRVSSVISGDPAIVGLVFVHRKL